MSTTPNVAMSVVLRPNTRKAKNRIHQAGTNVWSVLSVRDNIQSSSESGPWLMCAPVGKSYMCRWIRMNGDFHFKVKMCYFEEDKK